MSAHFKPGDLVMVVKPRACCGESGTSLGKVFSVLRAIEEFAGVRCNTCGAFIEEPSGYFILSSGSASHFSRLKKIDPPAEGDSLPTRKDIEVSV